MSRINCAKAWKKWCGQRIFSVTASCDARAVGGCAGTVKRREKRTAAAHDSLLSGLTHIHPNTGHPHTQAGPSPSFLSSISWSLVHAHKHFPPSSSLESSSNHHHPLHRRLNSYPHIHTTYPQQPQAPICWESQPASHTCITTGPSCASWPTSWSPSTPRSPLTQVLLRPMNTLHAGICTQFSTRPSCLSPSFSLGRCLS